MNLVLKICLVHIDIGLFNKLFGEFHSTLSETQKKLLFKWVSDSHATRDSYHGFAFAGNNIRKLCKNWKMIPDFDEKWMKFKRMVSCIDDIQRELFIIKFGLDEHFYT